MKATIAHYGIGNLLSVRRALEHVGATVNFAKTESEILQADRLVVPGVGAFKHCMDAIDRQNLRNSLITFAESGKPYLGICVGMQMLLDLSHEFGQHEGLGIISGDVSKIQAANQRIPFIGWKHVDFNVNEKLREHSNNYYFVHSYCAKAKNPEHEVAHYTLGNARVTAAIQKDNVLGLQFHPEKSGADGLALLKSFVSL